MNGDGGSDLFFYDASTGEWLQAMSLFDGQFLTYKGSWRPGYRISGGDFDGDGRPEVFALSSETGDWFQALPDGRGGFTYRSGIGLHDGDVRVADFNADSRDDVFVYEPSTGRWTLMLSGDDGPTFEVGNWGAGWDVSVTSLNGDGQADLLLWHAGSGQWVAYVFDSAGPFVYASGAGPAGGRVQPLDRDADGRDEIFHYDANTGRWTLTGIGPSGEVIQTEGVWEAGWSVASGDLDGDGRDDLLLYNPETGQLVKRLSRGSVWQDERAGSVAGPWAHGRPSTLTIVETSTPERATRLQQRDVQVTWLLGAMIVWSLFAVGGVHVWAGVPLMIAAVLLATLARPAPGAPRDTRMLDGLLLASVAAAAAQLVPLPPAVQAAVSPHADAIPLGDVPGTGGLGRLAADFNRARVDGVCVRARADRTRGVLDGEKGLRARHDAADRSHGRLRGPRRRTDRDHRQGARRPDLDLRTMAGARR